MSLARLGVIFQNFVHQQEYNNFQSQSDTFSKYTGTFYRSWLGKQSYLQAVLK